MPNLKFASSKRRGRFSDLLAVGLLVGILAGVGWLWWQEKHSPRQSSKTDKAQASEKAEPHKVVPSLVLVERKPEPVSAVTNTSPVSASTNAAPAMGTSNVPPTEVVTVREKPVTAVAVADYPRPARTIFEAQIALARRAISPGSIDGALGSQTRAALATFQQLERLTTTRDFDTNTQSLLTIDGPLMTQYVVTSNDVARLQPLGKTWIAKSEQSALEYENILQLVAEKAHAHPALMEKLNPGIDWGHVAPGTVLKMPVVKYPEPADKAACVVIHLSARYLEAFGADSNLLAHFPCSIAARVDKRPIGELHVAVIAPHPNYTFDPAIFAESPEAQAIGHKLVLPPGPKNPVGVAWIGLDKPGYGMHGTPSPVQIGRTESHGCFRLANWDAEYLVKLVWIGMPVYVEP